MHIIIGGCGRVGAELADELSSDEHDVVVIDAKANAFDRIGGAFNGETVVGDITDKEVLVRAGIQRADAVAAVTDLDNANLMSVQIARELFDVRFTVARLFNPMREEAYRRMGVRYVSGTRLVSRAILNELHEDAYPVHVGFDQDSDVEVVELTMRLEGEITVAELEDRGQLRVAAVRRDGRVRVARPADRLMNGDLIVAGLHRSARSKVREIAASPLEAVER